MSIMGVWILKVKLFGPSLCSSDYTHQFRISGLKIVHKIVLQKIREFVKVSAYFELF